jgi:hypothetical protein
MMHLLFNNTRLGKKLCGSPSDTARGAKSGDCQDERLERIANSLLG